MLINTIPSYGCDLKVKVTDYISHLFYLPCLSKIRSSNGTTLSVCPSKTLFGCLQFQKFIQTFHNDGSHIEDVHLLFCAYFMNIFSIFRGVELRHFYVQKCLDGVWFV